MEIRTEHLLLREFRDSDLAALREIESDPEMYRYESGPPDEHKLQDLLTKCQEQSQEIPRTCFRLAVVVPPADEVIGRVSLSLQFDVIREWEVGWSIRRSMWGRGFATQAAYALIDYAFRTLNAHRVVAFCNAENAQSIRVMQKLGMRQDGHLRETRWLHDRWFDEKVFAILERDWESA